MRKILLALIIILALTVPVFGQVITNTSTSTSTATGGTVTLTTGPTTATGGAGGSVTIAPNAIKNTNTLDVNTDIGVIGAFSPFSKTFSPEASAEQKQKQQQDMNNNQVIDPHQSTKINIEARTPLLAAPSQGVSELNFGNGRMKDVTAELPNFAMYGIKRLRSEPILRVLNVNANVKFKRLYKEILNDAKDVVNGNGNTSNDIRYQVIRSEAQKTWTTGGNLGGAGSGVAASGLAGGSMAGSVIPQWGGTKADDLFTIIFLRVSN